MTFTFYGLKACDTCRKARKELDAAGVEYAYRDVRGDDGSGGVAAADLRRWAAAVGWETLLNKSSTTWRNLPDADRSDLTETRAIKLLADNPTLIKRPIITNDTQVWVGWKADVKTAVLG